MAKRKHGAVCAFCGRKINYAKEPPIVHPNMNGMGLLSIAHVKCAQKAGVVK